MAVSGHIGFWLITKIVAWCQPSTSVILHVFGPSNSVEVRNPPNTILQTGLQVRYWIILWIYVIALTEHTSFELDICYIYTSVKVAGISIATNSAFLNRHSFRSLKKCWFNSYYLYVELVCDYSSFGWRSKLYSVQLWSSRFIRVDVHSHPHGWFLFQKMFQQIHKPKVCLLNWLDVSQSSWWDSNKCRFAAELDQEATSIGKDGIT